MSAAPKIAIQSTLLPGTTLDEKLYHAARYGFDGVELPVAVGADLGALVREADAASRQHGVPISSFCTARDHDPLHPDPDERRRRLAVLGELVEAAGALGAAGVVSVPIRPGLGAREGEEPAAAIAALTDEAVEVFGAWASALPHGAAPVFLEPLNRYEARFLTRVAQAAEIARRVDSPHVRALGDLFHMNIEEADPAAALTEAGAMLGHVHVADNTRRLPGAGSLDFAGCFRALHGSEYRGWLALECVAPAGQVLIEDHDVDLPATLAFLRQQWDAAARVSEGLGHG